MKIKQEVTNKWTKWFAWYPVKTEKDEWVWFETVKRKLYYARIDNIVPSSWAIYKRIK